MKIELELTSELEACFEHALNDTCPDWAIEGFKAIKKQVDKAKDNKKKTCLHCGESYTPKLPKRMTWGCEPTSAYDDPAIKYLSDTVNNIIEYLKAKE